VSGTNQASLWQRWLQQPQKIWLRRALFQVHLWSGIIVGLYVLMISVTGSIVEYSNEIYLATTIKPVISRGSGPLLSDAQLAAAARRLYPAYRIARIGHGRDPDQAVDIWLGRGKQIKKRRLFDPRSGADLGNSVPPGIRFISTLLDLHDNLLGGPTGREVNGFGALLVLVLGLSGLVIWWPGVKNWRRSLILPRGLGWKRWNWSLHSMVGFWSLAFTLVFALSGIYLVIPEAFQDLVDRLQPPTPANAGIRLGDRVIYWLAYLHFGRINGIGIPCHGPGICDQATKAVWALFGLAPAVMFVTGAIMWWNRVLHPRLARLRRERRTVAGD
jgi:uncharacterized iron-regulated membrane protein